MSALEVRAAALGEAAARRAAARIAAAVEEAIPGVRATVDADGVVLTARGLRRRWPDDARLRWIGGLVR